MVSGDISGPKIESSRYDMCEVRNILLRRCYRISKEEVFCSFSYSINCEQVSCGYFWPADK